MFFQTDYLLLLSAVYNSSKYRRNMYRHVTAWNVRFSDFSASSAVDVVETKTGIGQIVLAVKCIRTFVSIGLFTTIVCCSQHVEILTNSVSSLHWATCLIFLVIAKFGGRRRQNEKEYRPDCFSIKSFQDSSFERIIYHVCLQLTIRRNIDELCIGTSLDDMFDFWTFRQVRRSTSSKRNGYRPDSFSAKSYHNCSFDLIINHVCLLLITRRNIDELCIGTSLGKMSDFRTFC